MIRIYLILAINFCAFNVYALSVSNYYLVADDYIAPHLVPQHEQALLEFKREVDKVKYKGSWRFYEFDNGRHVAFSAKKNHDYEQSDQVQWQEVEEKFSEDFLSTNGEVYTKTIVNQDFYLMRYIKELSFGDRSLNAAPSKNLIWLELQLHRKPVRKYMSEWVKQLKQSKSKLKFSVYSKQYGANLPTLYIVFHCDSIVDFYEMLSQKNLIDPLRLLPQSIYQGVEEYDISVARYLPEISY
ncbi:hypothetical protein PA25_18200 [Pseudoalteromonas sp. A25]|uniref:hypothetical protein n=1 Tax=Pseudoalteromonas sp. A25 TaxID=116092 RepID=UPI0012605E1E|nr:hypothetical protein [Pseudoalteromonas sp. A25]BBN81835.1 hypothetical protein PA25_18200 [Pseudoalteromonas sp. A25]